MKRTLLALLIAALLVTGLVHPGPAAACSCADRTPQQLVDAADTIVVTKVTRISDIPGDFNALLFVERYLKGHANLRELTVDFQGPSGTCGLGFPSSGQRYVLLMELPGEPWRADFCSGSTELPGFEDHGTQLLQQIEAITGPGTAPSLPALPSGTASDGSTSDHLAAAGVCAVVLLLAASTYFLTRRIMTAR